MVAMKKTTECPDTVDRSESKPVLNAVRPRKSTKGKQRPTYRRRVKPPYSYAELIAMAIKSSPSGMMTLREILEHMSASYECFRGSYIGWKNSVRHNLSASDCFVKVLRNLQRPYGKDNFWTLAPSCHHCTGESGGVSPDRDPVTGLPPLHGPFQPRAPSSSPSVPAWSPRYSEGAASPYRSAGLQTESTRQPTAPAKRCASPTPGCTPGSGAAPTSVDHHHQACDEWSQLEPEDLFVPDDDIDLALYNEVFDLVIPHQPSAPICPSSTGQERPSLQHIKSEFPPSYPEYTPQDYAAYRPLTGLFPCGITERHIFGGVSIKSEYVPDGTTHAAERGPDRHGLGSIVASAIRGSLSLDLDESALQAIERSVRLLDRPRPNDLVCA